MSQHACGWQYRAALRSSRLAKGHLCKTCWPAKQLGWSNHNRTVNSALLKQGIVRIVRIRTKITLEVSWVA